MHIWREYGIEWTYPEEIADSYTEVGTDLQYARTLLACAFGNRGKIVSRLHTMGDWNVFYDE